MSDKVIVTRFDNVPEEQQVDLKDLSLEAHYAYNYVFALVGGKGSMAERVWFKANADLQLTQHAKRVALQTGLKELLDRGIIEGERDGLGEWQPTVFHLERVKAPPVDLLSI